MICLKSTNMDKLVEQTPQPLLPRSPSASALIVSARRGDICHLSQQ